MSLAFGRHYLAIPGPSVIPDRVLGAMHRAAPNIYQGELVEMMPGLLRDLRRVARTEKANVAIYIANGHGAWEAANANLFSRGDKILSAITGHFGNTWALSARNVGVDVESIDFDKKPIDPAQIEEALRADSAHRIKAVFVTHTDTATTIRNDVAAVRKAIDAAGHPALLAVDAIASLGCDPLHFDDWGIDVLISASQKGLMTPPGLSFIWFSDKALAASEGSEQVTPYWDWRLRSLSTEFYRYFAGTAPTHHLYGLREALTMLLDEEGLEAAWKRHAALASSVWAAFDAWSKGGDIALNVADKAMRSHSVTGARIGNGGAVRLREWLEKNAGVTLGIGLGMAAPTEPAYGDYLRIAHMGYVNAHMTLGVLSAMEAGMRSLGIPHGTGALDAAAQAIADAI
ncbi:alanine-glyoxylate transaminase/serine-glyoxylate transaminase/serine-pyruvate transaminase [Mesorhizobium soli]|uniref:pyridoxal-phosphate-dependent aminotransferase family protein n=1 Tax=Pseudaminobacter soli (ex Li et al. 2025) TaxID=1295366 RepID=UPI0024747538|nr:aminotransferase class V-fold PLP-dependent enzyme [Mesorhizobium soli]MDH6232965.1 alanine-glyoxylate transaminase/serine-glyoxylate transaminase/serine-pyruvate transaminase [Mesorhizobium soli]